MKDIFKDLLRANIDWQQSPEDPKLLQAYFQSKLVKLKLNDFPAEIMCTLIVDSDEQNWDDFPSNWTLPEHRDKKTARRQSN